MKTVRFVISTSFRKSDGEIESVGKGGVRMVSDDDASMLVAGGLATLIGEDETAVGPLYDEMAVRGPANKKKGKS